MKKKILAMSLATILCVALAACGKKEEAVVLPETAETQPVETQEVETQEVIASETTMENTTVEDEMESVALEKNERYEEISAMPKEDLAAFAEKIKTCVANKDIEGLADLVAYPTYVAVGDGLEIATKEEFVAIGADTLFTEELVAALKDFPTDNLETSMAGVVVGEKPSISFNLLDGSLGIQGINY